MLCPFGGSYKICSHQCSLQLLIREQMCAFAFIWDGLSVYACVPSTWFILVAFHTSHCSYVCDCCCCVLAHESMWSLSGRMRTRFWDSSQRRRKIELVLCFAFFFWAVPFCSNVRYIRMVRTILSSFIKNLFPLLHHIISIYYISELFFSKRSRMTWMCICCYILLLFAYTLTWMT